MVARISCLALAMGILVGCYDIPYPECGFACGPVGECPSSYACNVAVNRCELAGTSPHCAPALVDAALDADHDAPPDNTAPTVGKMVPSPDSFNVPLTQFITVSFSEDVMASTVHAGTFTVERPGGIQISGIVNYDPFARTATFQPVPQLLPNTLHTVFVYSFIADLAGNPLDMNHAWQFTTVADTTPPFVTLRSPAVNAINVGVGAPIFVDFSEDVTGVSSTSFRVMDGATPVAGTVSYAGTRATFTASTQLTADTPYTVSLTSAIRDRATVPNALTPVSWLFTTGADFQAPIVVTRTPLPASANVPVTTTVAASFDESVINVSTTSFTLTPMGGSPVAATIDYVGPTRTATLTPDVQLAPNTQHTAQLTTAITDAAANVLFPSVSWVFTTGADTFGPRVVVTTPADQSTAVPNISTIVIRFDEPVLNVTTTSFTVNAGAITGSIAMSAGNSVATFVPDVPLPASATITVNLTTAITDAIPNALVAPVTFSFMTAP